MRRRDWVATEGTVGGVERESGPDGHISYSVVFTYKVDGHFYGGTFTTFKERYVGETLPVKYDPSDPDRNSLVAAEMRVRWTIRILIVAGILPILFVPWLRV